MGINNSLLKSIQTIVDKTISDAFFDKTRQGIILSYNGNGVYEIELDGIRYKNVPTYPTNSLIKIGQIVKVKIPTNNTNKMYIETSDVAMVGEIKIYAGVNIPNGWLMCDGSEQLISKYPDLYAIIGDKYGVASDDEHFKLPNLGGRVPIGTSNEYDLATIGGNKEITLTKEQSGLPEHTHDFTQPTVNGGEVANGITGGGHAHTITFASYYRTASTSGAQSSSLPQSGDSKATSTETHTHNLPSHTHTVTGGEVLNNEGANASQPHDNMQPFVALNYIICAGNSVI